MTPETKKQIVAQLHGSQTGAIVACALGIAMPAPRFTSKAIVTSDGYVQANFVDRDGTTRHSAFVGSVDELQVNLSHAITFLQRTIDLSTEDSEELIDLVIPGWIATDYRKAA
jgi:hypothetical protein